MQIKLSRLLVFTVAILFLSCNSVNKKKESKAFDKNAKLIKNHILIDSTSLLNFNWSELSDTDKFEIRYLQLNFLTSPADENGVNTILKFTDSLNSKSILLTGKQVFDLNSLINKKNNFSEGDCGTFHLNAGFFILHKGEIWAIIDIGCGYCQWNFSSKNPNSKFGSLNEAGFKRMTSLLDDINLKDKD